MTSPRVDAQARQSAGQGSLKECAPLPWGAARRSPYGFGAAPQDSWIRRGRGALGFTRADARPGSSSLARIFTSAAFYFLHLLPVFSNFPNGFYFNIPATVFWRYSGFAVKELDPRKGAPWLGGRGSTRPRILARDYSFIRVQRPFVGRKPARSAGGRSLAVPISVMFHLTVPYGYLGREFFNHMMARSSTRSPRGRDALALGPAHLRFYMNDPVLSGLSPLRTARRPAACCATQRRWNDFSGMASS